MSPKLIIKIALLTAALCLPAFSAPGITEVDQTLRNAYYLEQHEKDLAGAALLYEQITQLRNASPDMRAEAAQRLASCREATKAQDLASLMPADTILYAELRHPGQHLGNLIEMLGLAGDPLAEPGRTPRIGIPGQPGIVLPQDLSISPALIRELSRFDSLAVAFTGFDLQTETPQGVIVINSGELDLLRGLIETAVQFVRPTDPISGFPAVAIDTPDIRATLAFTKRLIVAGTDRALVEGVLDRLSGKTIESLAGSPAFQERMAERSTALLFAHLNVQNALKIAYAAAQHDSDIRESLMMGQVAFDLAHLDSFTLTLGTDTDRLSGELRMALAEGQMNMVYNLVRTPPMRGRALRLAPAGSALVVALGVNPDLTAEGAQDVATKTQTVQAITGLDLAREVFANIREIAIFITPPIEDASAPSRHPMPDIALAMVVGDADKSEALWDFVLSLPAKFTQQQSGPPHSEVMNGAEVQAYAMPDGPIIRVARIEHAIIIGLTEEALRSTLDGIAQGQSVLDDPELKAAIARVTDNTCVAAVAHAGRIIRMAAAFAPQCERPLLEAISRTADRTHVALVIDESPTEFRLAGHIGGLPSVDAVIETLAESGVLAPPAQKHAQAGAEAEETTQY